MHSGHHLARLQHCSSSRFGHSKQAVLELYALCKVCTRNRQYLQRQACSIVPAPNPSDWLILNQTEQSRWRDRRACSGNGQRRGCCTRCQPPARWTGECALCGLTSQSAAARAAALGASIQPELRLRSRLECDRNSCTGRADAAACERDCGGRACACVGHCLLPDWRAL